jgi:hypothetical protein
MRPGSDVPEIYREADVPGLDLYAANCGALLAIVKYYMKDKLDAISPYICRRIDHLVYLRTLRPFIVAQFSWMTAAHNWPTGITTNVLIAMAATVEEMELRERIANKALWVFDNFTAGNARCLQWSQPPKSKAVVMPPTASRTCRSADWFAMQKRPRQE